ncbi:multicopper oxidase mco-like [Glandiceps talaboti]
MSFSVVSLVLLVVMTADARVDRLPDMQRKITEVESQNGRLDIQLTVAKYRFFGKVNFNTRAFYYNGVGSIPGPTLRVKAGDTIYLTLKNEIDHGTSNTESPLDSESYSSSESHSYTFSDYFSDYSDWSSESELTGGGAVDRPHRGPSNIRPLQRPFNESMLRSRARSMIFPPTQDVNLADIVNFYTYGLHIDPKEDRMQIGIKPKENHTYVIHIPPDHAPGLNWYSSHYHGTSAYHVGTGLAGAIIVDPANPSDIPSSLGSLEHYVMVLQNFNFIGGSVIACRCSPRQDRIRSSILCDHQRTEDQLDLGIEGYKEHNFYTVNGKPSEAITMETHERIVFRLVNAAHAKILELVLPGCDMHLIARDGVYRSQPSHVEVVILFPGSRADVVVSCAFAGTFSLHSERNHSLDYMFRAFSRNNRFIQEGLVVLKVSPNFSPVMPLPSRLPTLPTYLGGHDEVILSGLRANYKGSEADYTIKCHHFRSTCEHLYNGVSFEGVSNYSYSTESGNVEEWLLSGGPTILHPIHVHANHFQILFANSTGEGVLYEIGEWRDTLPIDGTMLIRIKFDNRFYGPVVIHNSFLEFEDSGMMEIIYVDRKSTLDTQTESPQQNNVINNANNQNTSTADKITTPSIVILGLVLYLHTIYILKNQ